jgi:pimeloyl-ACP methyl ester carboxylesterase
MSLVAPARLTHVSTFVLIPGAGGAAWYWHLVVPRLTAAGHTAIAVDLPGANPAAGLREYERIVLAAAAGASSVTLVAQSMGAFTALGTVHRLPVERLILLNAMVPNPGETPGDWWSNTGYVWPDDFDERAYFLHDVPPEIAAAGAAHQRPEEDIAFEQPAAFDAWPDVPTTVLAARDDRFFPYEFQARVVHERLGLDVVPVPGGHLAALSQPESVAAAMQGVPA